MTIHSSSTDQIDSYFAKMTDLLDDVRREQGRPLRDVADRMAETIAAGHSIFITGCSHSSIFAQEMFYRAGGLMLINPLFLPGMTLGSPPVTLTTRMERIPGIARSVLAESPVRCGDLLIVASVSGRNVVPVELAMEGKLLGATVVALTSTAYAEHAAGRHAGGKRLHELADYVLDMMVPPGDALLQIGGLQRRVAAASTVIGAAMLHAVIAQTVQLLSERGMDPPVFMSANLDGADEYNRRLLDRYKDRVHYM